MNTNSKLSVLYNSKYTKLSAILNVYNENSLLSDKHEKATNPLLLKVDEDWEKSDLKIMIFGQETNSWAGECGNDAIFCGKIDEVIQIYNDFYLQDRMYSSPFWNEFRKIRFEMNSQDKKLSVSWNNIVKIGRLGVGNNPNINKITNEVFNVIRDEIQILQPDYLIFLTGPNYDDKIKDAFGEFLKVEIEGFTVRQMCNIEFKENFGIKKAIRTYHPGYLYRNKERRIRFIDKLISELQI